MSLFSRCLGGGCRGGGLIGGSRGSSLAGRRRGGWGLARVAAVAAGRQGQQQDRGKGANRREEPGMQVLSAHFIYPFGSDGFGVRTSSFAANLFVARCAAVERSGSLAAKRKVNPVSVFCQALGHTAAQLVVAEVQPFQVGEVAQLRRYLPAQLVVAEV